MSINHIISEIKLQFKDKNLIIAELGVFKGESIPILETNLNLGKYYGIDLYQDYTVGQPKSLNIHNKNNSTAIENYNLIVNKYKNNKKINIIKNYTVESAKMFDDEYFDLVFIDAGHDYASVYNDIKYWYPKVKKGGIICGDDWHTPSVEKAVLDFFKNTNKRIYNSQSKNPWTRKKDLIQFNKFDIESPPDLLGIAFDHNNKPIIDKIEKRPYSWLVYT